MYNEFASTCAHVWDVGMEAHGRPGKVTSVTLPEGVLPLLSQLMNPADGTIVPVVRVPLYTIEYLDDEAAGEQPPV